jgi:glycosyltransferase involved in cell wall biosynthesis
MIDSPLINTSKLRILVSGHLPPIMGGIATYYQSLLNSSLPKLVDLRFVETSPQKRNQAQSGRFSLSNLVSALGDCGRFTMAVIKHNPELTHIATAEGLSFAKHGVCVMVARLFGSRVLLHPHCGFSVLYSDQPGWWQWFVRRIIRMTNGIITLSSEWNQLSAIMPSCPVYYLPNGIDLSVYRPIGLKRNMAAKRSHRLRVLYLGFMGKAKGSFDLVETAKRTSVRNIPLTYDLVGKDWTPGEVEELKTQIDHAKLQEIVRLHSPVFGVQKINFFREADIFIYPSYSEGMPIAVIEAMACGLPIIATRVGGLPDLVIDGTNGILVDAGCPDQLVNALEYMSSHSDLRFAMQKESFQRAFELFDIEKVVPRLLGIYKDTLKK